MARSQLRVNAVRLGHCDVVEMRGGSVRQREEEGVREKIKQLITHVACLFRYAESTDYILVTPFVRV